MILMTPQQIELVQQSWGKVVPIAKQAAALFYQRLFELAPHLRGLFSNDIEQQGKKLMSVLSTAVSSLKQLDKLEMTVWQLGRRHRAYGVKNEDYQPVAQALLWTLEQGLKSEFTEQVKVAWVAAFTLLATLMQQGAHYPYANFSKWKKSHIE